MNINRIILSGYLGQNPDLKATPSGKRITNFTLSNSQGYGDKQKTIWLKCTAFDKTAEYIQQYASKGDYAVIVGRLDKNEWTGTDNVTHKEYSILVDNIELKTKDKTAQPKSTEDNNPFKPTVDDNPFKAQTVADPWASDDGIPF